MNLQRKIRLGRLVMSIRPAFAASLVKLLLRIRRFEAVTQEGNFFVDPASYLGLRLLQHGNYEPDMLAVVKQLVPPGGTFVDVGANEGYFTIVGAKQVGPTGRVLAVEPQLRAREVLQRNLELNGLSNIALAPYAVSDRPGQSVLHLTPGVNNSASSLIQPTRYPLRRQTVDCLTLEEIFFRYHIANCDLLKIDIEGWEYEAVLGSLALFRGGCVKAIALELHPILLAKRGLNPDKITHFLEQCGYTPWPRSQNLVLVRTLTT